MAHVLAHAGFDRRVLEQQEAEEREREERRERKKAKKVGSTAHDFSIATSAARAFARPRYPPVTAFQSMPYRMQKLILIPAYIPAHNRAHCWGEAHGRILAAEGSKGG